MQTSRRRILAIAYTCMPGVGSEPEAGWAWTRLAATIGETWVLTRPWPDRRAELEAARAAAPEGDAIHIVYVDLPRPFGTPRWDPFLRGHQRIEYILWQIVAVRTARRIARREDIDLVWHLTFSNVWMGSVGALIGPTFILGPVGGGVGPVWRFLPGFGLRGIISEVSRSMVRTIARYFNPLARVAWSRASLILVQNPETASWLPRSTRARTEVFHNSVVDVPVVARTRSHAPGSSPVAMFAGRLIALKGTQLAIRTIALLPGWRLLVVGSGPEEKRLRALVKRLVLEERVEFRGWVAHDEVLRTMRDEADVFLFPSTHDEGSFVVAEAIASGLPVVCLDRGGPPVVGGSGVKVGSERQTIARLAREMKAAMLESAGTLPPPPTLGERRRGVTELLRKHGIIDGAWDDVDS